MSTNDEHLRPLVDLVVDSVYSLMDCQRVTLYFVDHSKKELWIALAKDEAVKGIRIPLGSGIAGRVALVSLGLQRCCTQSPLQVLTKRIMSNSLFCSGLCGPFHAVWVSYLCLVSDWASHHLEQLL